MLDQDQGGGAFRYRDGVVGDVVCVCVNILYSRLRVLVDIRCLALEL